MFLPAPQMVEVGHPKLPMKKRTSFFCITLFFMVSLVGCIYSFSHWMNAAPTATLAPSSESDSGETLPAQTTGVPVQATAASYSSPQTSAPPITLLDLIPAGESLATILPDSTHSFYYITYYIPSTTEESMPSAYQFLVRKYDLTTNSICLEQSYTTNDCAYWYQFQLRTNGIITFWTNGTMEYLDTNLQHCTFSRAHTAPGILSDDTHMFAWCENNLLYYFLDDSSETVSMELPTDQIGAYDYCYLNSLDVISFDGENHYIATLYVSTPDMQSGTVIMDVLTQTVYSCQPNYNIPQFFGNTFRYFEYIADTGSTLLWLGTRNHQLYTIESADKPFLHAFNSSDFMTVHSSSDGQMTADFICTQSLDSETLQVKRIPWMAFESDASSFFYTLEDGQIYLLPVHSEETGSSQIYLVDVRQGNDVAAEYPLTSHSIENAIVPFEVSQSDGDEAALSEAREYARALADTYGFEAIHIGMDCPESIGNYSCTQNSDVYMVWQSLQILDETLQLYPQSFFRELLLDENDKIEIYLVGTLSAVDTAGLSQAGGIVYEDMTQAAAAFAIGEESGEYKLSNFTINHEFSHLIDRKLSSFPELNWESAWNQENPADFYYADTYQNYEANTLWDGYTYAMPNCASPYFLSRYSTTFCKEDRAEVFAYSMSYVQTGSANYFTADYPHLRNKLQLYCSQLRQVLDTSQWPDVTNWEAALHSSSS